MSDDQINIKMTGEVQTQVIEPDFTLNAQADYPTVVGADPTHAAIEESLMIPTAPVQTVLVDVPAKPDFKTQLPWFVASVVAGLVFTNFFFKRGKK